jgi:hypothetical protein
MQSAVLHFLDVKRDPHHPVGIVPPEVGLDQAMAHDFGFFIGRSSRSQQGDRVTQQGITGNYRQLTHSKTEYQIGKEKKF